MKAAPGGNSRTGRSAPPSVEDVAGRAAGCDSGERNMATERGGAGQDLRALEGDAGREPGVCVTGFRRGERWGDGENI